MTSMSMNPPNKISLDETSEETKSRSYKAYSLPELKRQLKSMKNKIVSNRKDVYRKVKEIEELQEFNRLNNRDKKLLIREIKNRLRSDI